MLQMAVVLTFAAEVPVVKVGRMAGQFAKPRSSPTEKRRRRGAAELSRRHHQRRRLHRRRAHPRPQRQLEAYRQSAATLNLLRAFARAATPTSTTCMRWTARLRAQDSPFGKQYRELADRSPRRCGSCAPCGVDPETVPALHRVDFYTSHEALLLGYEEALVAAIDSTHAAAGTRPRAT